LPRHTDLARSTERAIARRDVRRLVERGTSPAPRTIAVPLAAEDGAERVRVGRPGAVTSEAIRRIASRVVRFLRRRARCSPLARSMRVRGRGRNAPALGLSVVAIRARRAVGLARADGMTSGALARAIVDACGAACALCAIASYRRATGAGKNARQPCEAEGEPDRREGHAVRTVRRRAPELSGKYAVLQLRHVSTADLAPRKRLVSGLA
jgi:hypothetical protein